ncbi:MAG: hypothetical protein WB770_01205 [Acidimicrobiales bacterium]
MTEPSAGDANGQGSYLGLPDELVAVRHRVASARERADRLVKRSRTHRRLISATVAGSAALVGLGIAEGFARSSVPAATNTSSAASTAGVTSALAADSAALVSGTRALEQVARDLAADQQLVAGLASSAAANVGANAGSTASPASSGAGSVALPSIPALPSLPAIPTTHASTGASSVPLG